MIQSYFIDTHCHLDLFQDIKHKVAFENNLPIKTITVTNSPSFFEPNIDLFRNLTNIRVALGLHPELVSNYHSQIDQLGKLITKTKYIGEIGLDGSKEYKGSFDEQVEIFKAILLLVKKSGEKILTIHSRNASKEVIDMTSTYLKNSDCKIILHWFTGNYTDLQNGISQGYFFSINHKMANSEKGKEIISRIPLSQLLTETDAPFTFNSKITNRLDSLKNTIENIAKIKNLSQEKIKSIIMNNFKILLTSK